MNDSLLPGSSIPPSEELSFLRELANKRGRACDPAIHIFALKDISKHS